MKKIIKLEVELPDEGLMNPAVCRALQKIVKQWGEHLTSLVCDVSGLGCQGGVEHEGHVVARWIVEEHESGIFQVPKEIPKTPQDPMDQHGTFDEFLDHVRKTSNPPPDIL